MNDGPTCGQLALFRQGVAWEELPIEVRRTATCLLSTLCVELVSEELPSAIQEANDAPPED